MQKLRIGDFTSNFLNQIYNTYNTKRKGRIEISTSFLLFTFALNLTAADKMHNLDFIRVFYIGCFPMFTPYDFFIQFNRHSFGRQVETFQQLEQICFNRNIFCLTIYKNFHN